MKSLWTSRLAPLARARGSNTVNPRSCVVLEYVDGKEEVEGSPVFVDSSRRLETLEEKDGFLDLVLWPSFLSQPLKVCTGSVKEIGVAKMVSEVEGGAFLSIDGCCPRKSFWGTDPVQLDEEDGWDERCVI